MGGQGAGSPERVDAALPRVGARVLDRVTHLVRRDACRGEALFLLGYPVVIQTAGRALFQRGHHLPCKVGAEPMADALEADGTGAAALDQAGLAGGDRAHAAASRRCSARYSAASL